MRLRPYFGDTYAGIVTIAFALAGACAALSAVMFFFRPVCEPILSVAITLFVHSVSRAYFAYDPATYWFWDGWVAFLGVFVLLIATVVIIRNRRRTDASIRRSVVKRPSSRTAHLWSHSKNVRFPPIADSPCPLNLQRLFRHRVGDLARPVKSVRQARLHRARGDIERLLRDYRPCGCAGFGCAVAGFGCCGDRLSRRSSLA